jgi:mannitol-specific phosphotransferase system IIBC component
LKPKSSFDAWIASLAIALLLVSGAANANEFITALTDAWVMFKEYIIPMIVGAIFAAGGYVMWQNQGKMLGTIVLLAVIVAIVVYGPTMFGFGSNK